jgi:glycerol kinase
MKERNFWGSKDCSVIPEMIESTALGAVYAAGLALGMWNSTSDLCSIELKSIRYTPSVSKEGISYMVHI